VVVSGARVAVTPAGGAVVVWERRSAVGVRSVLLARRPAGGPWTRPVLLATHPAGDALAPAVAVDAQGRFVAAWRRDGVSAVTGTVAGRVGAARRLGAGGATGVAVAAAADRALV